MSWLYIILVGAVAGWLGSFLFKGSGSGLIWNIILGVAGAFVGGWLFNQLKIQTEGLGVTILAAAIGAFVILWLFRLLGGGRPG